MAKYTLTAEQAQRWAALVAGGANGAGALRTVLGAAAAELSSDAVRSRAMRLSRSMAPRIAALRAERAAAAEEVDRPLTSAELLDLASEVTRALTRAIEAGEALGVPAALISQLRREIGAHAGRVVKMPSATVAAAPAPRQDGVAAMLERAGPCTCRVPA